MWTTNMDTSEYISLYSELATLVLERSSIDPIWQVDDNGNESMTEDKQDEFVDICNEVEDILSRHHVHKE